ncbi:TPA: nucleotide exchange factor GrpE [Candidatus Avigastranaerophilus faecigallinarum]|nr:nucleotide exchange factor GrpE [Candidatus Avigastranaerophilus faecigallinarum]
MKNFFENKLNKGNPFVDRKKKKGEEKNTMTDEIKENEQDIIEEQEENNEVEETSTEAEIAEENTDKESEKLKQDFENLNNQYLRLAADFDNYRKRQAQEREALLKYGAEECMKKIIEVVDNFDRALTMVEKIDTVEKMKETFYVLNKQLTESLSKLGLEQIKSVGEVFDPNMHEAVMQTPTDEYPEDTIINELQKGYKLGEKVLRPAMVSVAVKQ